MSIRVKSKWRGAAFDALAGIVVVVLLALPTSPVRVRVEEWRKERGRAAKIAAMWGDLTSSGGRLDDGADRVVLVEFMDYQCPSCRQASEMLEVLVGQNPDVGVVVRQLPLTQIHPMAEAAGKAAICAEEQGRFAEMHERLFDVARSAVNPEWGAVAAEVEIRDVSAFEDCLRSETTAARLAADKRLADELGVVGTPTFIHRRGLLRGANMEELKKTLESVKVLRGVR